MKQMIKRLLRNNLLNEGVSDIVYHFTSPERLLNILETDTLYLTPDMNQNGYENKLSGGKFFYLSTTTSRSSATGYYQQRSTLNRPMARITLDGRKINSNFRSYPVDYFSPLDGATKDKNDLSRDEMELRVVSNNSTIKSFSKYITCVEVVNGEYKDHKNLKHICDNLNIPFYVYNEIKYFNASYKKMAIEIESLTPYDKHIYNNQKQINHTQNVLEPYGDGFAMIKLIGYILVNNQDITLEQIINDYELDTTNGVDENIKDVVSKLGHVFKDEKDIPIILKDLNHTIKKLKTNPSKLFRYVLNILVSDMRRKGVVNLEGYLKTKIIKPKRDVEWERVNKLIDQAREEIVDEHIQDSDIYELFFRKVYELKKVIKNKYSEDNINNVNQKELYDTVVSGEDSNGITQLISLLISKIF